MEQKSRLKAGLFAFLLGGVGVHSFYLGFKTKGILHIVLYAVGVTLSFIPYLGWFTGLPLATANSIWALVEAIQIVANRNYVDANGNTLA